jgi:hypothetical protein
MYTSDQIECLNHAASLQEQGYTFEHAIASAYQLYQTDITHRHDDGQVDQSSGTDIYGWVSG